MRRKVAVDPRPAAGNDLSYLACQISFAEYPAYVATPATSALHNSIANVNESLRPYMNTYPEDAL